MENLVVLRDQIVAMPAEKIGKGEPRRAGCFAYVRCRCRIGIHCDRFLACTYLHRTMVYIYVLIAERNLGVGARKQLCCCSVCKTGQTPHPSPYLATNQQIMRQHTKWIHEFLCRFMRMEEFSLTCFEVPWANQGKRRYVHYTSL